MGVFRTTLLGAACIVVIAFVGNLLLGGDSIVSPVMTDGWFGRGSRQTDIDESIKPFTIHVDDLILDDLKRRIDNTRLGEDLENVKFEYGFRVSFMKDVISYWQNEYDWRKHEAILNNFPQFKTNIEGIDIHFIHVKPNKPTGRVLLMSHGWPGSVWEFHKILPMLTDPEAHGGKSEDAFEVICPSLPGYGYSEAAHQPGMSYVATGRIFVKLMSRLGHNKFYLQGGDWGSMVSTIIAMAYPQRVQGIHLNMYAPPNGMESNIKLMIGGYFPSLIGVSEWEYTRTYPLKDTFMKLLRNLGYFHFQATKPDTLAFGLNDSPVGLAAYIMEKYGAWTVDEDRHLNSLDGLVTEKFTMDEILTNVMIYWTTGTIGSSMRYYKENLAGFEEVQAWDWVPVDVPTALAAFPNELFVIPKTIAEIRFKNVYQFTEMPRGGHFAALEEPRLLADDIFLFVQQVEKK